MPFIPNPNFEAEMALASRGLLVAAAAKAGAKASQVAHHTMPRNGQPTIVVQPDELGAVLANTNHGAAIEEFGGADVHSPVYAPLRRGVRAAGFRLFES